MSLQTLIFVKRNTTLNYIGQIEEVHSQQSQLKIRFLPKQPGGTMFKFPSIEDVDIISDSYIVERLQEPQMNNREYYTFKQLTSHVGYCNEIDRSGVLIGNLFI